MDTTVAMPRRKRHISAGDEPEIGKRLGLLRNERGLTQVQLAEKLGMSQPLLSRYERGELRLHGALVAELAKALEVTTDELLGVKKLKGNGRARGLDRRVIQLAEQIEQLPKRDKQTLLKTIDAYVKGSRIR